MERGLGGELIVDRSRKPLSLEYNNISFPTSGSYTIEYRVASGTNGGTISSDLNAGSIQLGSTAVPATGGWQNWRTVSRTVNVNAGTYNFGVYAQTGGYNLNWIRITKQATAATAAPAATGLDLAPAGAGPPAGPLGLDVYPNPQAGGPLTLQLSNYDAALPTTIRITSLTGAEVWHDTVMGGTGELSQRTTLKSGLYLIQVQHAAQTIVRKLVISMKANS